ncbi:hypothetical protein HC928_15235 [bacterium]|nr:hypothetical protein [bacterium]
MHYMPSAHQERLKEAYQLIRTGQRQAAQPMVLAVLRQDLNNADAWVLAAMASDKVPEQCRAVRRALALQPDHPQALKLMQELGCTPTEASLDLAPPPATRKRKSSASRKKSAVPGWFWMAMLGAGLLITLGVLTFSGLDTTGLGSDFRSGPSPYYSASNPISGLVFRPAGPADPAGDFRPDPPQVVGATGRPQLLKYYAVW